MDSVLSVDGIRNMKINARWLLLVAYLAATPLHAEQPTVGKTVSRAESYLRSVQGEDGSFSPYVGPAVTALVATGLMRNGRTPIDPLVGDSLDYLLGFVQEDGGIYGEGSMYRNYETCVAIQCLRVASDFPGADPKYSVPLAGAERFIKGLQWDEEEGHDSSSPSHGGAGYGRHRRPDLSNTSYLVDALKSLGRDGNDPAMQRALAFVSRAQNLETEHNNTAFAAKVNDGGFYYTPAAGGSSQAGETDEGGLRSYGSMTYAGLKSMIYAGVGPDDARVLAATQWIERHYSLDENPGMRPGMEKAGLYYYYHTFAKALAATGEPAVVDADGVEHNWRAELVAKLAAEQGADGSWINTNEKWLEADPNLATAYALLALSYCDAAE